MSLEKALVKIKEDLKSWDKFLGNITSNKDFHQVIQKVIEGRKERTVLPSVTDIFRAYKLVKPKDVKVVIIGQDPYPQNGVADGLCFSTQNAETPASLRLLFRKIAFEYGKYNYKDFFKTNNLENWARQGVLLLNSRLTVFENEPNSHTDFNWDTTILGSTIHYLSRLVQPQVHIYIGNSAKKLVFYSNPGLTKDLFLKHPSAVLRNNIMERDWFEVPIFKETNAYLIKNGLTPIEWRLK